MWVWDSIMPGRTVTLDRSMTFAPGGSVELDSTYALDTVAADYDFLIRFALP